MCNCDSAEDVMRNGDEQVVVIEVKKRKPRLFGGALAGVTLALWVGQALAGVSHLALSLARSSWAMAG
jgi:hypothetical protein